jgi:hypothetical protein
VDCIWQHVHRLMGACKAMTIRCSKPCGAVDDGKTIELEFLDQSGHPISLLLSFEDAESIAMTLPRAVEAQTGKDNSRYLIVLGQWRLEGLKDSPRDLWRAGLGAARGRRCGRPCAGPGLILTGAALEGASVKISLLLLSFAAGAATSLGLAVAVGGRVFAARNRCWSLHAHRTDRYGAKLHENVVGISCAIRRRMA